MKPKKIKTEKLFRGVEIRKDNIDAEKRTLDLSFSSEEPYERYFGTEILDHTKKSVRLDRLNDGGALLVDHDVTDQIGVIEKAYIGDGRKGRALVRFGKSNRAEEVFNDVIDGIKTKVSVGYIIHKMKQEESDPESPIFRATDWEPLEVSLVAIPADTTVGTNREYETIIEKRETKKMPENIETKNQTSENVGPTQPAPFTPVETPAPPVDRAKIEKEIRKDELTRQKEITAIGRHFKCDELALDAIEAGTTVDAFRQQVLEKIKNDFPMETTEKNIGLSTNEVKRYSVIRLINALANPTDRSAQKNAAFEFDCHRAVADKLDKEARGAFIPSDVMLRDLNTTDDSALVGTTHLPGSFIDVLRNRVVAIAAGATMLNGLVGNLSIPRKATGAAFAWIAAEGDAAAESEPTFDAVTLSPNDIASYTEVTRRMRKQSSPDVDNIVLMDLAAGAAVGIDAAVFHGSGASGQPMGIAATAGIGSVVGGTDGAAPDWADIVDLETEISQDNADIGALAYITNAKVRGKLKQTEKATNTAQFVWADGATPLNGYRALVTNNVSSTLTKGASSGICSAIFFGNWTDIFIGMWGILDLLVDPYTNSATGALRITAFQTVDVAVRHPESFAAMLDALTT